MNGIYGDRIKALRDVMQQEGIDFYVVPTSDFHNSEYVDDYFKVRDYLSGFTGSNGSLVVTREEAGLWTDGRYFIQAENQLSGSGIVLYRMQEEGVPSIAEFLKQKMHKGQTLGFDGRVVDTATGMKWEEALKENDIAIVYDRDLADRIWLDRPPLPCHDLCIFPEEIWGRSVEEKLADVRKKMQEYDCGSYLCSKLDDLMWLFNVRGKDIQCNPVALSYGYITMEEAWLFVQEQAITAEARDYASAHGIILMPYGQVISFLEQVPVAGNILYDAANTSYTLMKTITGRGHCINKSNPTELLKAVKNNVELDRMREVYLKDSAAVCKFICWVKKNVGSRPLTELTAAEYLDHLRSETEGFLDLSFPTIAAYRENAAMMHYEAKPGSCSEINAEGMLLVDSGGQYIGGTTDVTRTIVCGPVTEEIKKHYTAVAMGMLRLQDGKFLHGCTGRNLDILARQPVWDLDIDYKCGTGHGVGYILNVHEGPQGIRWRYTETQKEAVIEEGMTVTDEPGVYREGSHGIRIENVLIARNGVKNSDGQFMYFEPLTFAPIDLEAIDVSMMDKKDLRLLNAYHQAVYEKIAPFLSAEEAEWLHHATRKI